MAFQMVEIQRGIYELGNLIEDYNEDDENYAVWSFIRKVKHQKEIDAVQVIFEQCFVYMKSNDTTIILIGNLTQKSKDYIKTELS